MSNNRHCLASTIHVYRGKNCLYTHCLVSTIVYTACTQPYQPFDDGDSIPGTPLQLIEGVMAIRIHRPHRMEVLGEFPCHQEGVVVGDVERGLGFVWCAIFLVELVEREEAIFTLHVAILRKINHI